MSTNYPIMMRINEVFNLAAFSHKYQSAEKILAIFERQWMERRPFIRNSSFHIWQNQTGMTVLKSYTRSVTEIVFVVLDVSHDQRMRWSISSQIRPDR